MFYYFYTRFLNTGKSRVLPYYVLSLIPEWKFVIEWPERSMMCWTFLSYLFHLKIVSEWLLFNANSAIYQLYHGENKVTFNVKKKKFWQPVCLYAFTENIYEMKILSERRCRAYERGIQSVHHFLGLFSTIFSLFR